MPVAYAYRNGAIYGISVEGQKLRFLREHPGGVCLEVDEIDDVRNWKSVTVTGRFEELVGDERLDAAAQAMHRSAQGPLRFELADGDIYREPDAAVLWKVVIEELSGRTEKWEFAEGYRYW